MGSGDRICAAVADAVVGCGDDGRGGAVRTPEIRARDAEAVGIGLEGLRIRNFVVGHDAWHEPWRQDAVSRKVAAAAIAIVAPHPDRAVPLDANAMVVAAHRHDDVAEARHLLGHGMAIGGSVGRSIAQLAILIHAPFPDRPIGPERHRIVVSRPDGNDVAQPYHLDRSQLFLKRPVA